MHSKGKVLVTGAGGFIGHHLVNRLKSEGFWVRGVDIKRPEYAPTAADEFELLDLREWANCLQATRSGIEHVYHLAADMGGIGYISGNHATIARNSVLMTLHLLEAGRLNGVKKFLFSSSACVYAQYKQKSAEVAPLKEEDAWPADPEPGYGLEKLYSEELCRYYRNDFGIETRVVRFHNVFGPLGTYEGGKEKAPAAIARKVALAISEIDVWGDGEQTRTFMYIDDCVEGIRRLMDSSYAEPLNLGRDELVTINELVDITARVAGKRIQKRHDLSKPQGVRGRSSDNTKIKEVLGWSPVISLEEGIRRTYPWIRGELTSSGRIKETETRNPHASHAGIAATTTASL